MNALALAYVAVGGAVGSMGRYFVQILCERYVAIELPVSTFAVNILGSFLMGAWVAVVTLWMPAKARDLHLLLGIGMLGGFTTFSAFSFDIFLLLDRGLLAQVVLYALGTVVFSVLALAAGAWMIKFIAG